jgi:hypothetical protein
MADYIDRNILCQAYVHVDLADYEEGVGRLEQLALPLVKERAQFFLYPDATIEFEPSEGSIKSRITFFGCIVVALQAISNYKDFREGISLLKQDVERVADMAVTETLFALSARNKQVVRIEVRTGVVGSLHRILGEIERIRNENGVATTRVQAGRIERLHDEVDALLSNIRNAEDIELVAGELYLEVRKLPQNPLPSPREPRTSQAVIDNFRSRRAALLAILKSAKG